MSNDTIGKVLGTIAGFAGLGFVGVALATRKSSTISNPERKPKKAKTKGWYVEKVNGKEYFDFLKRDDGLVQATRFWKRDGDIFSGWIVSVVGREAFEYSDVIPKREHAIEVMMGWKVEENDGKRRRKIS